jgi:hypothetical protein
MPVSLFGLFIVLHGLVHLWYVALSQRPVEFRPEMGWTGHPWICSGLIGNAATRSLAGALYTTAAIALVAGGVGVWLQAGWSRSALIVAAAWSTMLISLFWDGSMQRVMEKGLIGLLICLAIAATALARQ